MSGNKRIDIDAIVDIGSALVMAYEDLVTRGDSIMAWKYIKDKEGDEGYTFWYDHFWLEDEETIDYRKLWTSFWDYWPDSIELEIHTRDYRDPEDFLVGAFFALTNEDYVIEQISEATRNEFLRCPHRRKVWEDFGVESAEDGWEDSPAGIAFWVLYDEIRERVLRRVLYRAFPEKIIER